MSENGNKPLSISQNEPEEERGKKEIIPNQVVRDSGALCD